MFRGVICWLLGHRFAMVARMGPARGKIKCLCCKRYYGFYGRYEVWQWTEKDEAELVEFAPRMGNADKD